VRYEHLLQINDPTRPDIRPLSRAQLWRGLVLRAARPEVFDPSIDASRTLEEDPTRQLREVRRSTATVTESVELEPETQVTLTIVGGGGLSGSRLEIRIEEPAPAALFVRFVYELRGPELPTDAGELQALR
jgi:acetylaranotin biosynthesis cluster protein L